MSLKTHIRNGYVLLSIIVITILLLKEGCSPSSFFRGDVISSDTSIVYLPGGSDTIYKETEKIVYRDRDFHHYHTDTVYNTDSSDFSVGYMYNKKDSVINAEIGFWAKERPDSITFKYSAIIPNIIDTVIKEVTIIDKVRVNQLYFGGNATVYPGFNSLTMGVDFVSKRGFQVEIGIGYDLSNNNPMVNLGYKKLISFRKK